MELIESMSLWWIAIAGLALFWMPTVLQHMENKALAERQAKERRYLEAVAMLTAEEKREIGIE